VALTLLLAVEIGKAINNRRYTKRVSVL